MSDKILYINQPNRARFKPYTLFWKIYWVTKGKGTYSNLTNTQNAKLLLTILVPVQHVYPGCLAATVSANVQARNIHSADYKNSHVFANVCSAINAYSGVFH